MKKIYKHRKHIIDPSPGKMEDGSYTASGSIYPEGNREQGKFFDMITIVPKSFSSSEKATDIFIAFAKLRIASGSL